MREIKHFVFVLFLSASLLERVDAGNDAWILVDTHKLTLEVKRGNKTVSVIDNISIGRNGAGFKHRKGDDITPMGQYKISWVNRNSQFYRFYGFDYPSVENANDALNSGLLDEREHRTIINAHKRKNRPPQNTSIGGRIGIHGLGAADKAIHRIMNWTHGCIAVNNKQLDELGRWIKVGTRVIVK